jgi:ADP-ribose pyrophosphatase YjhB (NUDIX family)
VHITASAIVVSDAGDKVALHMHKRLNMWLQPGGHIEAGETADESDEQALFELVEYVRMGIIYIYDLLQPADTGTSKAETYH